MDKYDELWDSESGLFPLFGESVSADRNHDTWIEYWQTYNTVSDGIAVIALGGVGSSYKRVVIL